MRVLARNRGRLSYVCPACSLPQPHPPKQKETAAVGGWVFCREVFSITARVMSCLVDYSTWHAAFSRLQYVSCRVFVDYSTCRVAFCRLQHVSCRVWSITARAVSRLVDYSACHVAFCRLQYVSCRVLSITACVMSRFVDYSTSRVAFCRLHYVSCRVLSINPSSHLNSTKIARV